MRARDLTVDYPSLSANAPASEAGELLGREDVDALFIRDDEGGLVSVITDVTLLRCLLPAYLDDNEALARVLGEDVSDTLWRRLEGRSVGQLLPEAGAEVPEVDAEDSLVEVTFAACRTRAPLVAVREHGEILGGITTSALVKRLLERP